MGAPAHPVALDNVEVLEIDQAAWSLLIIGDLDPYLQPAATRRASLPTRSAKSHFRVRRERAGEFQLLVGPIARTLRFADAYLTLVKADHSSEAVVLARAALEHAVTAQWVFITEGGVDRFRVETAHDLREHYSKMAVWLDSEELRAGLALIDPLPIGKRMPPFMNLLREVDEAGYLETNYHVLSLQVHVTHDAVVSFFEEQNGQSFIKYEQEYASEYQAIQPVAMACMLARWILAQLTEDAALLRYLEERSDTLLFPMRLGDNLSPERRRPGV